MKNKDLLIDSGGSYILRDGSKTNILLQYETWRIGSTWYESFIDPITKEIFQENGKSGEISYSNKEKDKDIVKYGETFDLTYTWMRTIDATINYIVPIPSISGMLSEYNWINKTKNAGKDETSSLYKKIKSIALSDNLNLQILNLRLLCEEAYLKELEFVRLNPMFDAGLIYRYPREKPRTPSQQSNYLKSGYMFNIEEYHKPKEIVKQITPIDISLNNTYKINI